MPSSICRACAGSPTLSLRSTDRAQSCSSHDPPATTRCGCCSPSSWATPRRRQYASVRTTFAGTLASQTQAMIVWLTMLSGNREAISPNKRSRNSYSAGWVTSNAWPQALSCVVCINRHSRNAFVLTSCQNSVGDARCPEALQLENRCGKAAEYAQLWPGTAQHQRRSCQRCDRPSQKKKHLSTSRTARPSEHAVIMSGERERVVRTVELEYDPDATVLGVRQQPIDVRQRVGRLRTCSRDRSSLFRVSSYVALHLAQARSCARSSHSVKSPAKGDTRARMDRRCAPNAPSVKFGKAVEASGTDSASVACQWRTLSLFCAMASRKPSSTAKGYCRHRDGTAPSESATGQRLAGLSRSAGQCRA